MKSNNIIELLNICYHQKIKELNYWNDICRKEQKIPLGDWHTWIILAGRGWGKTRTGAETVKQLILENKAKYIALLGRTELEIRQIMVEGESGILNIFPDWMRPNYYSSKRIIYFHNGAIAKLYSSERPNQLRGSQHDLAWCDELSSWYYPEENWSNLMLGLRLGEDPKAIVTTTPKSLRIIHDFRRRSREDFKIRITRGNSYENSDNLSIKFIDILKQYKGTTIERQEIYGEILDDINNLWTLDLINKSRIEFIDLNKLQCIILSIDPAISSKNTSDETGILVIGKDYHNHIYLLEDASGRYTPSEWSKIIDLLYRKWKINFVIGEINQGGDLIEHNLKIINPMINYKAVRVYKSKSLRNMPVKLLYEQELIHHVGLFSILEQQMVGHHDNDDRLDALILGVNELFFSFQNCKQNYYNPNIKFLDIL